MDFVPLSRVAWPRARTTARRPSQFKAGHEATVKLLLTELQNVHASRVTLYAHMGARDIRIDGFPRSDARAGDPSVMITFETRHGPVQLACDTYLDWKSNLRAIALTLEHLRAVERYGATRPGQQYKGYRPELPATQQASSDQDDLDQAAKLLTATARRGGYLTSPARLRSDLIDLQRAYRAAIKVAHPDCGGSNEEAHAVNAAWEMLKA